MKKKSKETTVEEEPSFASKVAGSLLFFGMAYGAYALLFSGSSPDEVAKQPSCTSELSCAVEEHKISAEVACDREIERLANYSHEWTDGWLEPRYTRQSWDGESRAAFRLFGDSIQFQNGFGAWQNHIYMCRYDFERGVVIGVEAEPGRL
jgi:hypothetical protein